MAKQLYIVNNSAFSVISESISNGKDYPQFALFSNTWPSVINLFKELGVLRLFKYMSLSCASGFKKPDANAFQDLFWQTGCMPSDICLFDDNIENIKIASNFNMKAYKTTFDTLTTRMKEVIFEGV